MKPLLLLLCLITKCAICFAQSDDRSIMTDTSRQSLADAYSKLSDKTLNKISSKYQDLDNTINKQSLKLLEKMQQKESKLQRLVQNKDSLKAQQLFAGTTEKYEALRQQLSAPFSNRVNSPLKEYIPNLDSLSTSLKFLQQAKSSLPVDKLQNIQALSGKVTEFQNKLQQANEIQSFIRQREQQLKESLSQLGFVKQLKGINKEVYYYQQRLTEYKELLHDKKQPENKVLSLVRGLPAFQKFWAKNSYLSQLFSMPGDPLTSQALAGLQTRASVQASLQQRMGSSIGAGGASPRQFVQQQVQAAQTQLDKLKDKLNKFGGGSSDMTMPDFKPNDQKTKSFLQRIEYGLNIQSEKAHSILPVTSDLALTAGYKLNDKSTIGIGTSYKLGWGNGWRHIKFSSQGIGLRSYVDIKAKGNIWLSGGYELNYMHEFTKYEQLRDINLWQRSGLVGLTKKYKIGKKENNLQVLWDFLSYQQVPRTPAIKFRIGYKF